ncbi:hypothetical protein ACFL27_10945 [candidate division CSSED10-310 bacterium]|uniref:Uncharacterized protein n=1 Tax=candidate division CSSED10-310 bacterium TaxID=2855610 RepID=A0ABV6YWZ5_UNCC1
MKQKILIREDDVSITLVYVLILKNEQIDVVTAACREEGEVTEEEVKAQLFSEMLTPFKILATIPGIRHIISFPAATLVRLTTTKAVNSGNRCHGFWLDHKLLKMKEFFEKDVFFCHRAGREVISYADGFRLKPE